MEPITLLAKMKAHQVHKAQPIASHLHIDIPKDALVLSFVSMSGEDTTIHIAMVSTLSGEPYVCWVPDPRNRDDQFVLFRRLAERLLPYLDQCWQEGRAPQLWVSSKGAAKHLSHVGQRMLSKRAPEDVQALGRLLAHITKRAAVPGQQCLITATSALTAHYATGQTTLEDEHLGSLLVWMKEHVDAKALMDELEHAEAYPMGHHTNPQFDLDVLAPLVGTFNESKRQGASPERLRSLDESIRRALLPVVKHIHEGIKQAMNFLQQSKLKVSSDYLKELREQEAIAFRGAFDNAGVPAFYNRFPGGDSVKQSTLELSARERIQSNVEALSLRYDRVKQARAQLSGSLVCGEVQAVSKVKEGRKSINHITLCSRQKILHVRPGDVLSCLYRDRMSLCVASTESRSDGTTLLHLRQTAGMKKWGVPSQGESLTLTSTEVDWYMIGKERSVFSKRLRLEPFTHDKRTSPISVPKKHTTPINLTAAVEALR